MIADQIQTARQHLYTSRNPFSYSGKSLLRRYQRSFFGGASLLNLGTEILGIGIYKPVQLVVLSPTRIENFHFQVETATATEARAKVQVALNRHADQPHELNVIATLLDPDTGEAAARAESITSGTDVTLALTVTDPKLWWPNGNGTPNLYTLRLEVLNGSARESVIERRVGLKRVQIIEEREQGRRTFQFVVNGTNVWVRGQNPIPIDYIAVHGSDQAYDELLRLVVESNGNLVRIWAGGAIENAHFFEKCDELGILLWQDFFLHSTTYPDYDEAWVEEFRQESVELVHAVRNHACLALLCGGNETEQGWDEWGWRGDLDRFYGAPLIKELLPELSANEAPEIPYISNSPHGGVIEASPDEGEMHLWGNFINAWKDPLFITETCWNLQSYSRPETLAATMHLNLDDYNELGWPGKWTALTKLPLITKYPYSDYFRSRTLREYLRSLEIEHMQADYFALKTLRLTAPSLTGIVNWSFNKGGPLFEFGCVDYLGYPLMNFYTIKRLFADIVVGVNRDINDIRVVASNLTRQKIQAELRITHFDAKGSVARTWLETVSLGTEGITRISELDGYYNKIKDRRREFIHVQLVVDDAVVAEDSLFFVPLAEIEIGSDAIQTRVTKGEPDTWGTETWIVELSSDAPQKLVQLEGNQKWLFSDNYFTLIPGSPRKLVATLLQRVSPAQPTLTVSSLDVPAEQTFELV
jgi:beta-mannosidase